MPWIDMSLIITVFLTEKVKTVTRTITSVLYYFDKINRLRYFIFILIYNKHWTIMQVFVAREQDNVEYCMKLFTCQLLLEKRGNTLYMIKRSFRKPSFLHFYIRIVEKQRFAEGWILHIFQVPIQTVYSDMSTILIICI